MKNLKRKILGVCCVAPLFLVFVAFIWGLVLSVIHVEFTPLLLFVGSIVGVLGLCRLAFYGIDLLDEEDKKGKNL